MSASTLSLVTVPFFMGAIGYVTNWTGVLMLFYPVRFRGVRARWLRRVARLLPHRVQQIPGVMVGGLGWQGIIPSRAAKMGSLAVDAGISKLGRPRDYWEQFEPETMARQIVISTRGELRQVAERIMAREHPRLWNDLPYPLKEMLHERVQAQLPHVARELTEQIGRNIDELIDIKLMVINRFTPELANRVFLDMGSRELKFIQNFGFFFGFLLGVPVAAFTHFVTFWWLLPLLGVVVGYVTNDVALYMIYEPPRPRRVGPFKLHGLFIRRQPEVAEVYAQIVADEILTMSNIGDELLHGPRADRTRAMIEAAMRPAVDRALGPLRPAVRVALGGRGYDRVAASFASEPVEQMMVPLSDPEFNRDRSRPIRKLIADRMRQMDPRDFSEMLHMATEQDEWLLLLHGAVLGFGAGLVHLAIFG